MGGFGGAGEFETSVPIAKLVTSILGLRCKEIERRNEWRGIEGGNRRRDRSTVARQEDERIEIEGENKGEPSD